MSWQTGDKISYNIMDPAGNITALVESGITAEEQPSVAALIMQKYPHIEQVGFVRPPGLEDPDVQTVLRMAGGEFCGNASMCAAALYLQNSLSSEDTDPDDADQDIVNTVSLQVSGAADPVEVRLVKTSPGTWSASVRMPEAHSVTQEEFVFAGYRGKLPVVRMEGITHIIIEEESPFTALLKNRSLAEKAAGEWCASMNARGLGLMFLSEGLLSEENGTTALEEPDLRLTPLVFVPGSDTLFWENSCASGSAAASIYLASVSGQPVRLLLEEPGGTHLAESDPTGRSTWISGKIRLVQHFRESLRSCP